MALGDKETPKPKSSPGPTLRERIQKLAEAEVDARLIEVLLEIESKL